MKYPNFNEEKKLQRRGYMMIAGLDEAGRGPIAGPVVASAVVFLNPKFKISDIDVNDSKKLTAGQREKVYGYFKNNSNIGWGIGIVSEKVIDKINILEATKIAFQKALFQAGRKLEKNIDFLILDGNFKINSKIPQKSIIKADQKVFSCALASIFAKVTRDRIMQKYHKKYPHYGFDKHKGYGTRVHFANLKKFGACKIHRKSFYPVSEA